MFDDLFADLARGDDDARWRAGLRLAAIGAPAVSGLVAALADPDVRTRYAATCAVRDMGPAGADAVPALVANLAREGDPSAPGPVTEHGLRLTTLVALGEIGPAAAGAAAALAGVLRDHASLAGYEASAFELRSLAAWALARIGPAAVAHETSVVPALAAGLDDPERQVRINAAMALASCGGKLANDALNGARASPDRITREIAARAIGEITGATPGLPPDPVPVPVERWAALDRTDFLLATQPLQTQNRRIDQDRLTRAFVDARFGNAFSFWPDHTWFAIPMPSAEEMSGWGMAAIWYFFTEDIYNAKLAHDWGYATVRDYNRAVVDRILAMGRALGKERVLWSVGHEQMDSAAHWAQQPDGSKRPPAFRTKAEGYAFYADWIRTTRHSLHWCGPYGNWRPHKFHKGWNTGALATWDFLAVEGIDTSAVTMMSGGVSPVLAHATFDILPQVGMYWWECQIEGTSLQVGAAYVRGAARQYGKNWLCDVSPWSSIYASPGHHPDGSWRKGTTPPTQARSWTYGYLAGADAVFEEASNLSHIHEKTDGTLALTETGRAAREVAEFCFARCPDRGEPYAPVAILLEHAHGFEPRPHTNFRGDGAWFYLPKTDAEREIERFWELAFPGHSTFPDKETAPAGDPTAIEPRILVPGRFGDCFDVLTDRAPEQVLERYPRMIALGGVAVAGDIFARLAGYVAAGGELLLNAAHVPDDCPPDLAAFLGFTTGEWIAGTVGAEGTPISLRAARIGMADVVMRTKEGLPLLTANAVGDGKAYVSLARHNLAGAPIDDGSPWLAPVAEFLDLWIAPVWPVRVTSHAPLQLALNRLDGGWLVILGNHGAEDVAATVSLAVPGASHVEIADVNSGAACDAVVANGTVTFPARVPRYGFGVYRVR